MGKKRRPLEKPDLMFEAREVEAISFTCNGCRTRIEVPLDGELPEGAVCPSCGGKIRDTKSFARFRELFDDIGGDSGIRFRVTRLTRLRPRRAD